MRPSSLQPSDVTIAGGRVVSPGTAVSQRGVPPVRLKKATRPPFCCSPTLVRVRMSSVKPEAVTHRGTIVGFVSLASMVVSNSSA